MLLIDFINVGYGDCILIREMKENRPAYTMLVDCGDVHIPRPEYSKRLSGWEFLQAEGIDHLDLAVITHLHLDHVGGLPLIADHCTIDRLWCNHLPPESFWGKQLTRRESLSPGAGNLFVAYNLFSESLAKLKAKGTVIDQAPAMLGELLPGAQELQATVTCGASDLLERQNRIWGDAIQTGAKDASLSDLDGWVNDASIRLRFSWKGWEFELPGDLGVNHWQAAQPGPCHILKLPHHGHKRCVTPSLLEQLSPASTVICVSNDRTDDCPSLEILELLRRENREVFFTDAVLWNGEAARQHSLRFTLEGELPSHHLAKPQANRHVIGSLVREAQPS